MESGLMSSRVRGSGDLTEEGISFDDPRRTSHTLKVKKSSSTLNLIGQDAMKLKEAAGDQSARSSTSSWIVGGLDDVQKDIRDVLDASMSKLSSGNKDAFASELKQKVQQHDTYSKQNFDIIQKHLGESNPELWISDSNQREILTHMGSNLR